MINGESLCHQRGAKKAIIQDWLRREGWLGPPPTRGGLHLRVAVCRVMERLTGYFGYETFLFSGSAQTRRFNFGCHLSL